MRAVVFLLLMSWLGGIAWAAGADDPRTQLRAVKENLDLIDQAQMSYGGRYPPQLVTDISRYVALPAQLEEWRGAMRAAEAQLDAGRRDEAAALLAPLAARTGAARALADDIVHYWVMRANYDRKIARWQRFIETNRVDPPQAAPIATLRQRLDAAMATQDFRLAGRTLLPELESLLDAGFDAGSTLALQVERDDRLALARETACPPAPANLQPGRSGRPQLDASRSEPTEKYFPLRARREDRVGRVGVEADVGADGCATRAVVLVSSGEPDFDRAALNWALQGAAYLPAQGEGGLAAGRTRFWVRFELLNP